jgi:hypothetical protein
MIHLPTRRGSVFIIAMAMLAIMTAAAYGFLMSAQAGRETAASLNHLHLARLAARSGTDHAIALLRSEFLATPGTPTNLNQRWRRDFAPIDGSGNSEDPTWWNENDLRPNDRSWYPLSGWWRNGTASAYAGNVFADGNYNEYGVTMHNGLARWYEPGWYNADASKTVSFHLPPTATAPDLQDPLYLDDRWRVMTPDSSDPARDTWAEVRALARYRLRYAVSIQDLTGHLLSHVSGAYWSPDNTSVPWSGAQYSFDELDNDPVKGQDGSTSIAVGRPYRAALYAPAFYDMGVVIGFNPGGDNRQIAQSFAGMGSGFSGAAIPGGTFATKGFAKHTDGKVYATDMNGEMITWGTNPLAQAGVGPAFSWDHLRVMYDQGQSQVTQFILTPYGRAHDNVETDTKKWYWGPSDNPWRINILTAPAGVIRGMIFGYLPGEAKVYDGTLKKAKWTGRDANGSDQYTDFDALPNTEAYLSWERRSLAWPLVGGATQWQGAAGKWDHASFGPDPYPGDPNQTVTGWSKDLGESCKVNELGDGQLGTLVGNDPGGNAVPLTLDGLANPGGSRPQPRDPVSGASYIYHYNNTLVILQEGENEDRNGDGNPGGATRKGERWTLEPPANRLTTLNRTGGYIHNNSYFLDIAQALMHTVGVVRNAWQDADSNGAPDHPTSYDTMEEIDRAFVEAMGERWAASSGTAGAGTGKFSRRTGHWGTSGWVDEYLTSEIALGAAPLTGMTIFGATRGGVALTADEKNLMELVLNDVRMSFFGASPDYCDLNGTARFTPFDFSHDGNVYCSAYRDPATASDPTNAAAWKSWRQPASAGLGPIPAASRLRSVTGTFALQKSRYWRILVRGQVWDNRLSKVVSETNQETAYALDPDGSVFDRTNQFMTGQSATTTGLNDSCILLQKWITNRNQMNRLTTYP